MWNVTWKRLQSPRPLVESVTNLCPLDRLSLPAKCTNAKRTNAKCTNAKCTNVRQMWSMESDIVPRKGLLRFKNLLLKNCRRSAWPDFATNMSRIFRPICSIYNKCTYLIFDQLIWIYAHKTQKLRITSHQIFVVANLFISLKRFFEVRHIYTFMFCLFCIFCLKRERDCLNHLKHHPGTMEGEK